MKKYLGIDWGEKRIGLAISEPGLKLALPLKIVSELQEVMAVIKEEEVTVIVLGQPNKLSGESANNPSWLQFYQTLVQKSALPVILVDERLSSKELQALITGGDEQKRRSKEKIKSKKKIINKNAYDDKVAALLLQSYLNSL